MSSTVVITGANRGIGLSLARHYAAQGHRVFGVCRRSSPELRASGAEMLEGIDVADEASISQLRRKLGAAGIDILINNAGVLQNEVLGRINYDSIRHQFEVNALGPLRVIEALQSNLSSGAKLAVITSRMGSIADNTSGGRYGYRMSKAALNIAAVSLAQDLGTRGIAVAIIHPGLVGTDMIGGHGDITPDEAAARIARRIDELSLETSGSFWHSNGEILPW